MEKEQAEYYFSLPFVFSLSDRGDPFYGSATRSKSVTVSETVRKRGGMLKRLLLTPIT
jgi:hypothetical protein